MVSDVWEGFGRPEGALLAESVMIGKRRRGLGPPKNTRTEHAHRTRALTGQVRGACVTVAERKWKEGTTAKVLSSRTAHTLFNSGFTSSWFAALCV